MTSFIFYVHAPEQQGTGKPRPIKAHRRSGVKGWPSVSRVALVDEIDCCGRRDFAIPGNMINSVT